MSQKIIGVFKSLKMLKNKENICMSTPLIKPPPKKIISINLRKDQIKLLHKIKKKDKIPISNIVEQLIDDRFEEELKPKKNIL